MQDYDSPKKMLAIEPIMDFDLEPFIEAIKLVKPQFVYIGYDNYNCHLPEPSLSKTQELICQLRTITTVKIKTLREKCGE